MRRWLPHPLLSALVFAFWLLLVETPDPAQVVLAALLAVGLPRAASSLRAGSRPLRAPGAALRLVARVACDVVTSNLQVARLVLGSRRRIRSRFIEVPCRLDDPGAVALLAGIITLTPGTLTVDISPDRRTLVIHCLHAPDPQAVIDSIRERYERPLAEIFSCSMPPS